MLIAIVNAAGMRIKYVFTLLLCTTACNAQMVVVHGHRGSRATRPENTIPAFEYAIGHGADVLELDLAVTKDNVLVVSHSPVLNSSFPGERECVGPPLAKDTPIHTLTLQQLQQYDCGAKTLPTFPKQVAVPNTHIPTFDEVLDLAPRGNFQFNVETKIFPLHPEMTPSPEVFVQMIDTAVRKHHLEQRVILQSFDFRTLHAMQALDPAIRRSALFGQAKYDKLMGINEPDKSFANIVKVSGANILSPDASLVTPEEVAVAHKLGLQVLPYTPNTPEEWKRLTDAHVDGIITDDPEALRNWLRKQTPPLHP